MGSPLKTWVGSRRSLVANVARQVAALRFSRRLPLAPRMGAIALVAHPGFVPARLAAVQGGEALICVSVHAPGGAHYPNDATVILRQGETAIVLSRDPGQALYEGLVAPGIYELDVTADDLAATRREVDIPPEGKIASAYLGKNEWPVYRLGENIIRYEPHEAVLAAVFETGKPDPDAARELLAQFGELPITPRVIARDAELPFAAANGAIWLFDLTDPDRRAFVSEELRRILGQSGRELRIGMPVDLTPGQVKVLDNRYVVRFQPGADADRFSREAGGNVRERRFLQSPDIRLLEFPDGDFRAHQERIEGLVSQGVVVYAEPDLLSELTDTVFPATDPNDDLYGRQTNLRLQMVKEAWQLLAGEDEDWALGNPDVLVATLDTGLDLDHPDIQEPLSNGADPIARCFDFAGMRECGHVDYEPDDSHGMAVYGIIAAGTNNLHHIAGIAPNTRQIAIKRPDVDSVVYKDVLLWIAGFAPENAVANWPADPLPRGADIINCSHVVKHLALSGLMDDTLTQLTTSGRGGRGTVVVYGAGNDDACITGTSTWAAHASTLAVANSNRPQNGVETRASNSNWGREIDLCARGSGVWSLNDRGGAEPFGGTSAAAPTVAAAAALMLSVNPDPTWQEVRQILCDSAVPIDTATTDVVGAWTPDGTFSQWYGYGRLNVREAVAAAKALLPE